MKQKQVVAIDPQDSITVERLFRLYGAGLDTIAFLMKDDDINYNNLQHYIDVVEARHVELEMLKAGMAQKYKPDQGKEYNFEFDFQNNAIIFEEP